MGLVEDAIRLSAAAGAPEYPQYKPLPPHSGDAFGCGMPVSLDKATCEQLQVALGPAAVVCDDADDGLVLGTISSSFTAVDDADHSKAFGDATEEVDEEADQALTHAELA